MSLFQFVRGADDMYFVIGEDFHKYFWVYLAVVLALFVAFYVLQAAALYVIAKRNGYGNRWMAFIPIFNTYYIGVVSEKNNFFKAKAKTISLAAALVELAAVIMFTLYYVSFFILLGGGYIQPQYSLSNYFGVEAKVVTGYMAVDLPQNLYWAQWILAKSSTYITRWLELAYSALNVILLICFFRTYACKRYVIFSIFSIILPIQGAFMFAVRGNAAKNFAEYVTEQRQSQYRAYQEYMRNNPPPGYGENYGGGYSSPKPEDPFGGLGENKSESGKRDENDPFADM